VLNRDDVLVLLEDGPHSLAELSAWLELPASALAPALDAMGIKACEKCQRRFIRGKCTSGRFCTRRCYAPAPGPSHQKKAVEIPQTRGNSTGLYKNDAENPVADDLDDLADLDAAPADIDIDEDLDELAELENTRPRSRRRAQNAALRQPASRPTTMTMHPSGDTTSWWVGLSREELSSAAANEKERLAKSKFAHTLPVRMLS
jgi:hypothetical protein